MSLLLLLDENFLDQALWHAIQQHNAIHPLEAIDVLRVGDPGAPPRSTKDPAILRWAVDHNRVIITQDARTFTRHHKELLLTGLVTPGIAIVAENYTIPELVGSLVRPPVYTEAEDVSCQVHWLP